MHHIDKINVYLNTHQWKDLKEDNTTLDRSVSGETSKTNISSKIKQQRDRGHRLIRVRSTKVVSLFPT